MTDNVAVLQGYTKELIAVDSMGGDIFILVKPDTDLSDNCKVWNSDIQEFVHINGWMFTFNKP